MDKLGVDFLEQFVRDSQLSRTHCKGSKSIEDSKEQYLARGMIVTIIRKATECLPAARFRNSEGFNAVFWCRS